MQQQQRQKPLAEVGANTAQPQAKATNNPPTGQQNASAALNLTGRWNIAVDAGGQQITLTLNLVQQGGAVTGTIEGPNGSSPITNGTLTADGFMLKANLNVGQPIDISIDGKAVGNQMSKLL